MNSSKEKKNFWKKLKKPFFVMAPMDDVTDYPYRQIVLECGKPDVLFTEFTSADGLCSAGKNRLMYDLKFSKKEKPIVAQIFGAKPENFYKSSKLISKLGFDGVDINMGCPFKTIEKQGAGAALIKTPKLAQEIIKATRDGAGNMSVSVKTRIGHNKDVSKTWIPKLLKSNLDALTIHGRTAKEKSKVPTHWNVIKQISELIKNSEYDTIFIGNGDVNSVEEAKEKAKEYNVDGIMIGRAAMNNPWFFSGKSPNSISVENKLKLLVNHSYLYEKTFKNVKNFRNMRKFFSSYVTEFEGSKQLRVQLMAAQNAKDVEVIINDYLA